MPKLTVALLAAAVLIAGCGGDGDSDGDANGGREVTVDTGSLSKEQFIRRADAICRTRARKVEVDFEEFLSAHPEARSDPAAAADKVVETIYLPAFDAQSARIGSLGVPPGDEAAIAAILEAQQKGLSEAESHPLRFVRALDADYRPFAEAEELGAAYGFEHCGKG